MMKPKEEVKEVMTTVYDGNITLIKKIKQLEEKIKARDDHIALLKSSVKNLHRLLNEQEEELELKLKKSVQVPNFR